MFWFTFYAMSLSLMHKHLLIYVQPLIVIEHAQYFCNYQSLQRANFALHQHFLSCQICVNMENCLWIVGDHYIFSNIISYHDNMMLIKEYGLDCFQFVICQYHQLSTESRRTLMPSGGEHAIGWKPNLRDWFVPSSCFKTIA